MRQITQERGAKRRQIQEDETRKRKCAKGAEEEMREAAGKLPPQPCCSTSCTPNNTTETERDHGTQSDRLGDKQTGVGLCCLPEILM